MSVINQLTARAMLFIKTATSGWIQTNDNPNRLKLFLSTSMLHRLYLLPQAFHKRRLFVTATAELDMRLKIAAERWAHTNARGIRLLAIHSRLAVNGEKTLIVDFHQLVIDLHCLRLQSFCL
jgi:hypothetical protein